MSNEEVITNIVGRMTPLHLEIIALPDKLKCVKCKYVLKNAYQVSCGCRFCRTCIDDMISRGNQFCPGDSQECGGINLSIAVSDFRANKSVLKLIAKCCHVGCSYECPLADMESHMRVCSSKNSDYPLSVLGCAQGTLPGEEMSGHLLQESRGHSEILIGTVANISKDMEMLKRDLLLKNEQDRHLENEMKLLIDEMKLIKDENKSIKIENESMKREKEVLYDRVRQLSEKLERDSATVTAVTAVVASNQDEMEPIRGDIRSIKDQFDCMKCRVESIQVAVGLGQLEDWLIEEDVANTEWLNAKTSYQFGLTGTYQLTSHNPVRRGELWIYLIIWAGPIDSVLEWPFRCLVTVTVAHRNRRWSYSKQMLQCEIERPTDNQCSDSAAFVFRYATLRRAGVHLERGVRISCMVVPGTGQ